MARMAPLLIPMALACGLFLVMSQTAGAQEAGAFGAAGDALRGLETAGEGLGRNAVLLFVGLTVLSLAPGLAIMITCFPFVVTVLSILRQSIGLPQSPPNLLIVALSLMLTWFVMDPVLQEAWRVAGRPLQAGEITLGEAFDRGIQPFRQFMSARTDPETYAALEDVAPARIGGRAVTPDAAGFGADGLVAPPPAEGPAAGMQGGPDADAALAILVPSFMLSEIQRAFEVGFLVALPFLIIDLVVAAVLMSMGMMMVPPAVVSLPFKLAFFVVVDGWGLIAGALVRSYQ